MNNARIKVEKVPRTVKPQDNIISFAGSNDDQEPNNIYYFDDGFGTTRCNNGESPRQELPFATSSSELEHELAKPLYYGLLGDFTRLIAPQSEADPLAIYSQMLVIFGNCIGHNPFIELDGAYHYPNLYVVLIGDTAIGRKGTSLSHAKKPFEQVLPRYSKTRWMNGLSTGEGLIWMVRNHRDVLDKRLLIMETEFVRVLKVMTRPHNTLSSVMRNGWDNLPLQLITKSEPALSTDHHISLISHITEEELKKELGDVDLFNGFSNRFLWFMVKRSQLLPYGGQINPQTWDELVTRLKRTIEQARTVKHMSRDLQAHAHWGSIYPELVSTNYIGTLGAATNRATAQIMRTAMILALADGSSLIRIEHQKAALALWKRSFESATKLFGYRVSRGPLRRRFWMHFLNVVRKE